MWIVYSFNIWGHVFLKLVCNFLIEQVVPHVGLFKIYLKFNGQINNEDGWNDYFENGLMVSNRGDVNKKF